MNILINDSSSWKYKPNCAIPDGHELPSGIIRMAAIVTYNGKDYCGFQRQRHSPSVQEELEMALSFVADHPISVVCAGRTDTGVHATHQIIHFDTTASRNHSNWIKGVNSKLSDNVALYWISQVSPYFHSRFSAVERTYRYIILSKKIKPAFLTHEILWIKKELSINKMNQACQYLLGEQDFTTFRASGCQSNTAFRNVSKAILVSCGDFVIFEIKANAFLLHMVRNIVAAVLCVGVGKHDPLWIKAILDGKSRKLCPATASPCGLYLVDVDYPANFEIPQSSKGPFFIA